MQFNEELFDTHERTDKRRFEHLHILAAHEAGHVVVALALNLDIQDVRFNLGAETEDVSGWLKCKKWLLKMNLCPIESS